MFDLDGCDLVDDVMGKTGKRPSIEKVKTCTFCPLMGTRFKIRFLSPSSNVATKTVFLFTKLSLFDEVQIRIVWIPLARG